MHIKHAKNAQLFYQHRSVMREKFSEALTSVAPVTLIVLLLCFSVSPIPVATLTAFLIGAAMLILGMCLFTLGADLFMTPLGERLGATITKSRRLWVVAFVGFLIGIIVTISEPDLQVLANQVPSIPNPVIIWSVAVGVGVFLVVALLRVLFGIRLGTMLVAFYALVFVMCPFVSSDFWAIAFDSGGVTTGPMTVPFIMALGVGVSSMRSDKHAENDSFGLVALCSVGPILATLLLGIFYRSEGGSYVPVVVPDVADSRGLIELFTAALPTYLHEVLSALLPMVAFFIVFQIACMRLRGADFARMLVGFVYTFAGLVLFLTGVNVGFMPAGNYLGKMIASLPYNWILLPIAMVIGSFIVAAEPAVHVLNRQVEEITSGAIPQRAMNLALAVGVSISLGLSMLRVLTGLSVMWLLIPGYAVAIALSFVVPKIFTSIAFDSGGVASGPMTATFLLPFAMGACDAVGGNIVADAFGVVAMVAMTPLITIQVMGLYFQFKSARRPAAVEPAALEDIIELI